MIRPRIFLDCGYWRVSPMPRPYARHMAAWVLAHSYVYRLNERRKEPLEAVRQRAELLVVDAKSRGVVLTIEQTPLTPLAMGYYETVVSVRPSRERYGVILTHEANKQ